MTPKLSRCIKNIATLLLILIIETGVALNMDWFRQTSLGPWLLVLIGLGLLAWTLWIIRNSSERQEP